jgi:glycosyltransferase involved in cell wall biosynthesis
MKSIKVYLQYPWKFPDSPYYKYLVENPPKGIKYLNAEKQRGAITSKRLFWLSNFLKRSIRKFFSLLKISIPNVHLSPKENYDLIHCAHCLSKNLDKPWVADIEGIWQFYIENKTEKVKKKVKEILLRENCKKIMPWTQATAKEIIKEFPEIKSKIEIVYPAVPLPKYKKIKHNEINLLFVARYFYAKGGLETLEAFDYLTKKYNNVNALFVSQVPKDFLKKYENNKKIKFYNLMPQDKLVKEIYPKADIFVYPGYSDSFGFALLEAMSFGLPIVTVDAFARKEIVEDGKNGFVIDKPKIEWDKDKPVIKEKDRQRLIRNIIKKTSLLIENKKLRERIGKAGFKQVSQGKFSIKERNKKLRRIYKEALR